ncbi:MAG: adenylate/guanylate cyclase domain-containing protein [Deltaproteobacteria bacterium]|nr:adenylate/guanylate cyclase domain-containing protein [Deltaproteobacteria bacterium]
MTLFNGLVVFVLLTGMGFFYYEQTYAAEIEALQARIRSTVSILSKTLDVERLARLPATGEPTDTVYFETRAKLVRAVFDDPDMSTAYIFAPTSDPDTLRFVIDTTDTFHIPPAEPGKLYPASPQVLEGLRRITVEDDLSDDGYGLSLGGYGPLRLPDGRVFGMVGVDVEAKNIDKIRARILFTTLALYGAAFLVLALMALVVGRRVRGPIEAINRSASKIATGDFEHLIPIERHDEFGLMSHHFNTIAQSLKERDFLRDTFGRYVSPDIARRVLQDRSAAMLGGEEREVTVVFSDIEGYSTMTELVSPKEVLGMLNTYLGAMNEIIDQHDGCIIEFLGDAILTVFNAPNDVEGHADVGVRCAMKMRARLEELNLEWQKLPIAHIWQQAGKSSLKARIGIHSGKVVAGNLGSRTRMKYGLIGDVVNVAARIEALNKKLSTTLLASAETVALVSPETRALGQDMGSHEVKGRAHGVQVFSF